MLVHFGTADPVLVDWAVPNDAISQITFTPETYQMKLAALGWSMAARNTGGSPLTSIRFTASGNNTQNIEVFLVFRNFKGLMKVNNFQSKPIPVGEQVTLFAMAKKSTGEYVLHKENLTVSAGMEKNLELDVVSEDALLQAMNDL
jgi:hypothetical protein